MSQKGYGIPAWDTLVPFQALFRPVIQLSTKSSGFFRQHHYLLCTAVRCCAVGCCAVRMTAHVLTAKCAVADILQFTLTKGS